MRILHTADWHLGRIFQGVSLVDDQAVALASFVEHVRDAQPDVVVLAGDVYDRAVPPPDAVALLDEVLSEMTLDVRAPLLCISGNHDSPDRLQVWGKLLEERNVHLVGRLARSKPVVFVDEWGPVSFHLLPFAEAGTIKETLRQDLVDDSDDGQLTPHQERYLERVGRAHGAALQAQITATANTLGDGRHVLVAHGSVDGSSETDSERSLWSKAGHAVDPQCLLPFAYTALGHHHSPQTFLGGKARYSGSLLPYSFSEAGQQKSATLVDIDGDGHVHLEERPLAMRRQVRVERGTLHTLLHKARAAPSDDYIKVELDDSDSPIDPAGALKEHWPNLLVIERHRRLDEVVTTSTPSKGPEELSTVDMVRSFFTDVDQPLHDDDVAVLQQLIDDAVAQEHER